MFQIHGEGLSGNYIGNLMLVSGVEALPSTRLYELWIEQKLLGGKLAIRVGQQASDVEFIDSAYDDLFGYLAWEAARVDTKARRLPRQVSPHDRWWRTCYDIRGI